MKTSLCSFPPSRSCSLGSCKHDITPEKWAKWASDAALIRAERVGGCELTAVTRSFKLCPDFGVKRARYRSPDFTLTSIFMISTCCVFRTLCHLYWWTSSLLSLRLYLSAFTSLLLLSPPPAHAHFPARSQLWIRGVVMMRLMGALSVCMQRVEDKDDFWRTVWILRQCSAQINSSCYIKSLHASVMCRYCDLCRLMNKSFILKITSLSRGLLRSLFSVWTFGSAAPSPPFLRHVHSPLYLFLYVAFVYVTCLSLRGAEQEIKSWSVTQRHNTRRARTRAERWPGSAVCWFVCNCVCTGVSGKPVTVLSGDL